MTSPEPVQVAKRVNDSTKKSPLKVVSPIIKKYTGHRQGKIKKLKFPRVLHGGRTKQKKQIKPQLKTILPKTDAGNVIILEPELLPCALNLLKRKRKEDETEVVNEAATEPATTESDGKPLDNLQSKECNNRVNKSKILPNNKKKLKCLKNVEASIELLESDTLALQEKREQAFVENYLLRVQQRLKETDESQYNQFLDLISNFQSNGISVCDLYRKVKVLFSTHTDLTEDFVSFLTPEQAVECGVFMDHLLLTTMSDFLNMIDTYFAKSPHQIKKIHSVFESLAGKPNLNCEDVVNAVVPLLKGNQVLKDYFIHLLPNMRPPDSFCTDFEEVEYSELNSDVSDDEEIMEMIHLPEIEDVYGGDLCPCNCHESEQSQGQQHCISCSLKFINGKVFIQNGKLLRPARVVFDDYDMNYHRERLAPKLYPKRSKKKHRQSMFKDNLSPTKSCNLSSDEFKSDIEDEEKGKLKLTNGKSPRFNRKKSVSPKLCDKSQSRFAVTEPKGDPLDTSEDKAVAGKRLDMPTAVVKDEEKVFQPGGTDGQSNEDSTVRVSGTGPTPGKPFELPEIDLDDKSVPVLSMPPVNCEDDIKPEVPRFSDKERSNSPPVISIPETASLLLASSKPILSLLENLDEAKEASLDGSLGAEKTEGESEGSSVKDDVVKLEDDASLPWKIEEDRIILQTLQVQENCEETFLEIGKSIPTRSVEDIKKRFAELLNMLYEMKAKTTSG